MTNQQNKSKPTYRTYEDFDYEDLLTYAGLDCIATSGVLNKLAPRILESPHLEMFDGNKSRKVQAPSILQVTDNWEMRFHEFIIDMELNGIKYNVEGNLRIKAQMEEELEDLKGSIFSCIGKQIDLDSDKELSELLFKELGMVPERFTKKGQPSTDADAINKDLAKRYPQHAWLTDLAKYGDIVSLYRTFVRSYVEDHVKRDGRIHPQYNLHGTSSFRITGDSPNLTQLPNVKHGYNIRSLFGVDEGNIFLTADFSSAEVKVLGAISQDPGILQAIRDGLDFHSFAAAKIAGVEYDLFILELNYEGNDEKAKKQAKFRKGQRQAAKAVGFGINIMVPYYSNIVVNNSLNCWNPVRAISSQSIKGLVQMVQRLTDFLEQKMLGLTKVGNTASTWKQVMV